MPGLALLRNVIRLLPVTSSPLSAVNNKLLSNMSVEACPSSHHPRHYIIYYRHNIITIILTRLTKF